MGCWEQKPYDEVLAACEPERVECVAVDVEPSVAFAAEDRLFGFHFGRVFVTAVAAFEGFDVEDGIDHDAAA